MLRITLELLPKGDESKAKVIATGKITNTGTSGNDQLGNYKYELKSKGRLWREGIFKYFPRKRYNIWMLLCFILYQECSPRITKRGKK